MKYQSRPQQAWISVFAAILTLVIAAGSARAVDIGPMTWTPRSDWINVRNCSAITGGPNAKGDGVADDTAAIQAVLTYLADNQYTGNPTAPPAIRNAVTPKYLTVYFPAGTYKISSTLRLNSRQVSGMVGVSLIGCGSRTIMRWADTAPIGLAMFAPNGTDFMRYLGFVWDGNNRAGCGIELNTTTEYSPVPTYETQIRMENSSFRNFTATGTYISGESLPGAGIAQGFRTDINPPHTGNPTSESMVYNCRFSHCAVGVGTGMTGAGNFYMWMVDGCEFDNCGTGIYDKFAGGYIVTNDHFQNSSTVDILGSQAHVRHCTSSGSATFYTEIDDFASADVIQDCWVDRWTTPGPAVDFHKLGPNTVFDCQFTNPPAGATGAILSDNSNGLISSLFLSNNYAPAFPSGLGILDKKSRPTYHDIIPPGRRGGILSSPNQTFLKTAWPADSAHIIDVTLPPYTANNNGGDDSTATIQAAINAAKAANNGSIVYFPAGTYHVSSTLTASGGNYTLQGSGIRSSLRWLGGSSPILTISNPHNIAVQSLNFSDPTSDIVVTATGPSSVSFDNVHGLYVPNGDNSYAGGGAGQGIVLSNLPAGSVVSMGLVDMALTVVNCGPARIMAKFLLFSALTVSGTAPKTGFLCIEIAEGGQLGNYTTPSPDAYNITVSDNQDLTIGDYYTEQRRNDIDLERGAGTGTGHVTIQGVNSYGHLTSQPQTVVLANNYAGRLFYGSQQIGSASPSGFWPVNITQTGSNPLAILLAGDMFIPGAPALTLGSGATVVEARCVLQDVHNNETPLPDSPTPLTAPDLAAMAGGLDDLRQLEAANAAQQRGWPLAGNGMKPPSPPAAISPQKTRP